MKSSAQESLLKLPPKAEPHTILLAVTGMSPAVLTETIWALAQETPAIIPNEIIVLTTSVGEKAIQEQLFGPDQVWQNLRNALLKPRLAPSRRDNRLVFGPNPSHVKVFHQIAENGQPTPLSTIDSLEQNHAVADCTLHELWSYTQSESRLIVSIAGGYKTMSAIMISCLSILGRNTDRVTHVLVDSPYETAKPRFYHPDQEQQHLTGPNDATILAKNASVRLFDVPWVPFRPLLEKNLRLRNKPSSYTSFVATLRGDIERREKPSYRWNSDLKIGEISIGSEQYKVKNRAAALFAFLLQRAEQGFEPYSKHPDAELDLNKFLTSNYPGKESIGWGKPQAGSKFEVDDIRKALSELRKSAPGLLSSGKGTVGLVWRAKTNTAL